ncbi:MAG: ATP-dependent helicase, partial [Thermoplasmatales archaeon]
MTAIPWLKKGEACGNVRTSCFAHCYQSAGFSPGDGRVNSNFVSAVPGSGKTENLINKCYELMLSEGVEHVAAITFTERAAKEILERLRERASREGEINLIRQLPESNVGTIHNFCSKILRSYGSIIDLPWHFRVMDDLESHNLLEKTSRRYVISLRNSNRRYEAKTYLDWLLDEVGMDIEQIIREVVEIIETGKGYFSFMLNSNGAFFSKFSKEVVDTNVLKECIDRTRISVVPALVTIVSGAVEQYQLAKKREKLMDFDDLLVYALSIIYKKGDEISSKLKYILVDEFQDTDELQVLIFEKLLEYGSTFYIVGDLNQSIYSFRGAHPAAQKRLIERIENHQVMPTNRRSGRKLITFYNNFFPKIMNYQQMENLAEREGGAYLFIAEDKLMAVAEIIKRKVREGEKLSNIAILSRTSSDFFNLKRFLRDEGIEAVVISGESILKSQEGLDILSMVRYLGDPGDEVAQVSLLFSPFFNMGVSELASNKTQLFNLLKERFSKYREMLKSERIDFVLNKMLWREGYISNVLGQKDGPERVSRISRIMELVSSHVTAYGGDPFELAHWMKNAQETKESGPIDDLLNDDSKVKIMTIHQAKGLEFNVVIVYDLKSGSDRERYYVDEFLGVIPKKEKDFINSPSRGLFAKSEKFRFSSDEELRILYVAFTRARNELHLVIAEKELKDEKAINRGADIISIVQRALGIKAGLSTKERNEIVEKIGLIPEDIKRTEPLRTNEFRQEKTGNQGSGEVKLDIEDDELNETSILKFVSDSNDRILSFRLVEGGRRVTITEKGVRIYEDSPV